MNEWLQIAKQQLVMPYQSDDQQWYKDDLIIFKKERRTELLACLC